MIVLAIKTDQEKAYIGIFQDQYPLAESTWQAHRELSSTFYSVTDKLFQKSNLKPSDLQGIICFKGPGSFTGLRIGLSAANGLAYTLELPIVAEEGEAWIKKGINRLENGQSDQLALPVYGKEAHITQAQK